MCGPIALIQYLRFVSNLAKKKKKKKGKEVQFFGGQSSACIPTGCKNTPIERWPAGLAAWPVGRCDQLERRNRASRFPLEDASMVVVLVDMRGEVACLPG